MQVLGLASNVIRNGRVASRPFAAKTSSIEAARRRDSVQRRRGAMAEGLTAGQAERAAGVKRATLSCCEKKPDTVSTVGRILARLAKRRRQGRNARSPTPKSSAASS